MQPLRIIHSTFVPLALENIDTDQIIPARFLKATTKDGFGKNLFRDWRYVNNDETKPKADFVLPCREFQISEDPCAGSAKYLSQQSSCSAGALSGARDLATC